MTFLHSFEPGGVERIALRLVRRWRELGIDAPLFLGRSDGEMRGDVGRDLDCIVPPRLPIGIAHWETLWMIWTLPREVRRLRPDVLFCAGNTYTIIAVVLKLLLGRECPPILAKISNNLDRRDIAWWRRLPYRAWLRIQGWFLDHLVGMEAPMADEICEALRVSRDAISVIPDPALSLPQIDRLRQVPRRPALPGVDRWFVSVGRLVPQKNLALMLRAFHRGAREGDRLTIIGDGPEYWKLATLAVELGIGGRVEFWGYVPDPASLLNRFDVFLMSSNYEGVPAVVLEAIAARLPVITTDCSRSMADLLQRGALGELVAVGDERALATAIAGADPSAPDEKLSLAHVRRFTIERAAEAYLQVFVSLAPAAADRSHPRADGPIAQQALNDHTGDFAA